MRLTAREQEVVDALRQCQVAAKGALCAGVQTSYRTVLRSLRKYGYYTSFNCNSAFYTLADIPVFDAEGLWFHREVGFARYGTLEATVKAVVEASAAGYTVRELDARLRTRTANLLSRACGEERLGRYYTGREAVYLGAAPERQRQQREARQRELEAQRGASRVRIAGGALLPEGMDAGQVIGVLLQLIEQPGASAPLLAEALRQRGTRVSAREARRVVEFYGLEKKGALSQCRPCSTR